jgi:electron transfer flavoprotein alpha subunit
MENILLLLHSTPEGELSKLSLESVTAAAELAGQLEGAQVTVGLIGKEVQAAADQIAGCGAQRFLGVSGDEFETSRYSSDTAALEALVKAAEPTLVLAPATSRISRSLPGVAQRAGGRIDTHISSISVADGAPQVQRWFYRQRMVATLTRVQRPWFLIIESGICDPASAESAAASVEDIQVELAAQRTQVVGTEAAVGGTQTVRPDADLLFVAGAGWTKNQADGQPHVKDAEQAIGDFLEKSQASLGSSKSLVDQAGEGQDVISFMSHVNQVGQTGTTPRHPKGLATCCHGEEPHVVGWRFINERRAVNLDEGCGWAQGKADVLYVADAFEVMKKVNELLG